MYSHFHHLAIDYRLSTNTELINERIKAKNVREFTQCHIQSKTKITRIFVQILRMLSFNYWWKAFHFSLSLLIHFVFVVHFFVFLLAKMFWMWFVMWMKNWSKFVWIRNKDGHQEKLYQNLNIGSFCFVPVFFYQIFHAVE